MASRSTCANIAVYRSIRSAASDDLDRLTPAAGAHMLITTRWSDRHGLAGKVDVGVFSPEQAVDFLCARAASADRAGAATLAEAPGYLPLALDHAGCCCRNRRHIYAR